jgi:hypothetical protein
MNRDKMKELIDELGETVFNNYVMEVDPSVILGTDQKARLKGDRVKMITKYTGQFLNGVEQEAPVSVMRMGNGYKVMDGITRYRAKVKAHQKDPTQKLKISTIFQDCFDYDTEQWEDHQDAMNDHVGSQCASKEDMESAIDRRFKSGRLDRIVKEQNGGVSISPADHLDTYSLIAARWIRETLYPNSGKNVTFFKNRVKKAVKSSGNYHARITTYDRAHLQKKYSDAGGTEYSRYDGDLSYISGNERIFYIQEPAQLTPNVLGALWPHDVNHPGADFTLLFAPTNVDKLSDNDIKEKRKTLQAKLNDLEVSSRVKCRVVVKTPNQIDSDKVGFTTIWDSAPSAVIRRVKPA